MPAKSVPITQRCSAQIGRTQVVANSRGLVLRSDIEKGSEQVGALSPKHRVKVIGLARTQSGTTRAQVASASSGKELGWVTSTTKQRGQYGNQKHLLALPENTMLEASNPTEPRAVEKYGRRICAPQGAWSVGDEEKFREAYAQFGSRWDAIADTLKDHSANECSDHYYSAFSKNADEQKDGGWSTPNGDAVKALRETEAPALERPYHEKPLIVDTFPDAINRNVPDEEVFEHDPSRRASIVRLSEPAKRKA